MTGTPQDPAPPRQGEAPPPPGSGLLVSDYDYDLPEALIAAHPAARRDESRLLVVGPDRSASATHRVFRDIREYLHAGDVLVVNESKVLPARLFGKRLPGGGECEALLLAPHAPAPDGSERWSAMVRPGKKIRVGTPIVFADDFTAEVEQDLGGGERLLRFACPGGLRAALERYGNMPLPPYILARRGETRSTAEDRDRYQTVYARADGSVAAPTAGLHFTRDLLDQVQADGVEVARVTLHVGAGTFQPITVDRVDEHPMHAEEYEIPAAAAETIARAKREGRRVIAVGTTSTRTLETAANEDGSVRAERGESKLMIRPGHRWRVVDGLVTNFHLPRSTLLCLVSAMIGRERLLALYAEAIALGYRFYSYGDAMFIEPANRLETMR